MGEEMAKRAEILGKWLWILFWLFVPSMIAGFMSNESVLPISPQIYMAGKGIRAVCSLVYGGILLKLATVEERYRTAGICIFVSAAVSVLVIAISAAASILGLIISISGLIVALVGEYNEFQGHSNVLADVDDERSAKWTSLWKWYIGCILAMPCGLVVLTMIPLLGLILICCAGIGVIIVSIMKLVYLYQTAKVFREYSDEESAQ